MESAVMMLRRFLGLKRNTHPYDCSLSRLAGNLQAAMVTLGSFPHSQQSKVSLSLPETSGLEPAAVIADRQREFIEFAPEADPDSGGAGVFHGVRNGLLGDA